MSSPLRDPVVAGSTYDDFLYGSIERSSPGGEDECHGGGHRQDLAPLVRLVAAGEGGSQEEAGDCAGGEPEEMSGEVNPRPAAA